MSTLNTFIMRGEWLDCINGAPPEIQDKILAEMVRYGTGRELLYSDDWTISSCVNLVKGRIDASKNDYADKIEKGSNGGRKKGTDDKKIYDLAKNGMTAQQIADQLGCSKSTVDKSSGWKNRKEETFVF